MAITANVDSAVGGLTSKSTPLISFNAIIDFDMSLIKHILINYRNPKVFNLEKAKSMTYREILFELYWRKYSNPLYFLMKNENDKEFLDNCYEEFKLDKEAEVYKNAVSTEIYNLMLEFQNSSDIIPSILYYTQAQKDLLDSVEELSKIQKYSLRSAKKPKDIIFGQYFFRELSEVLPFEDLTGKTFYFSTIGSNLTDNNDDLNDNDLLLRLVKKGNNISVFDLYKSEYIGRQEENDNS